MRASLLLLLLALATFVGAVETIDPPALAAKLAAAHDEAEVAAVADAVRAAAPAARVAFLGLVGGSGAKAAVPLVEELVADPDDAVVRAALVAYRQLGPRLAGIGGVRRAAADGGAQTRVMAMLVLGDAGDLASIPLLIQRLAADEPDQREAAHLALIRLAGADFGERPAPWTEWHAASESEADTVLPRLARQIHDRDPATVKLAISRLALMADHRNEACELIAPLLKSPDDAIADLAAVTLRRLGGPVAAATGVLDQSLHAPATRDGRLALVVPVRSRVLTSMVSTVVGRPLSDQLAALVVAAMLLAIVGAVVLLVFLMRTRPVAKLTRSMTRRVLQVTTQRLGKTARALKKRLKRITFSGS